MAFTEGANNVVTVLREYERCFGKQINFGKSFVYFSSNVYHGIHATIEGALSVRSITDPRNYLGLPVVVGSNKKYAFRAIRDRFLGKFESWYNQCLSQGGKAGKTISRSRIGVLRRAFVYFKEIGGLRFRDLSKVKIALLKQGQGNNLHLLGVVFGLLKASFKCEVVGKWGMGAPSLYKMMLGFLVHSLAKSILIGRVAEFPETLGQFILSILLAGHDLSNRWRLFLEDNGEYSV
ncbi:reverse transcriptase [Gossypium australe]|uniref:Reverse transcriptase n=1 Tax=Gossypium australe TaxID=47621 RepID=A0A5B6VA36_9ROSI|nr:reverse transcriptase [Gossypium australe]